MGPREQYVHQGSTVTLTCIVPAPYSHGTRPPRVVDWFRSDRPVTIQVQQQNMDKVTRTNFLYRSSKWRAVYLYGTKHLMYARLDCIAAFYTR
jgi:nitroimidazol reductase NimA-like FMN-containing flavoprotein (pyridoxamine 5'-phosphate oxidase superfamily)